MRSADLILATALILTAGACSDDTTNSLGSDNGDAGSSGIGGSASGGSDQGGGSSIVDETGGSAGSGTAGTGTGGDPGSGGTGTGGDPGSGGGGFSASGGNWLSSGGTGTGGDPGSGGTVTGGAAGSAGTGSGGDTGSGGTGTGGDAGSAGTGVGGIGTGGTGTGGGGAGGAGGTDCPMLPSCNWCGGEDLVDANGCVTGWICANGIDPCENSVGPCVDPTDCEADEVCDDGLCWPDPPAHLTTSYFDWVANPCTTDPCLPGLVGALVDPSTNLTHTIVDDGSWVTQGTWDGFDGFTPLPGQPVMADGRVSYHTDIDGQVYLEIELTFLAGRTG